MQEVLNVLEEDEVMVSQIYQLSFPLTVILLLLAVICMVVLFVCVRWCLRLSGYVISTLYRQPCDGKQQNVDNVAQMKEE